MNICQYCKTEFQTKSNLANHIRTAKYCIKQRGEPINVNYACDGCKKSFIKKFDFERHQKTCSCKFSEHERDKFIIELQHSQNTISELRAQVKDLQDQLASIARESAKRPVTIHNNQRVNHTNRVNTIINNLLPITDEHLKEQAKHLTIDHILDGANGYARYALEFPFKNRIVCVDFGRRRIKFKDGDNIVDDPDMIKMSKKLFLAIDVHNRNLISEYTEELKEKLFNDPRDELTEAECEELQVQSDKMLNSFFSASAARCDVSAIARGERPEMFNEFVKNVCSATLP